MTHNGAMSPSVVGGCEGSRTADSIPAAANMAASGNASTSSGSTSQRPGDSPAVMDTSDGGGSNARTNGLSVVNNKYGMHNPVDKKSIIINNNSSVLNNDNIKIVDSTRTELTDRTSSSDSGVNENSNSDLNLTKDSIGDCREKVNGDEGNGDSVSRECNAEEMIGDEEQIASLTKEEVLALSGEELWQKWQQHSRQIEKLKAKLLQPTSISQDGGDEGELHEINERLKSQLSEAQRKEAYHVMRLNAKEHELQEMVGSVAASKCFTVGRCSRLDPAVNLCIERLKRDLETARSKMEEAQHELAAWKFTPDSNTGKQLMAKCRLLIKENEELGRVISSGKLAKLEGDIALQRNFTEELKKSQSELDEFLLEMDEDTEGMQGTILYLQHQLRSAKQQLQQQINSSPAPTRPTTPPLTHTSTSVVSHSSIPPPANTFTPPLAHTSTPPSVPGCTAPLTVAVPPPVTVPVPPQTHVDLSSIAGPSTPPAPECPNTCATETGPSTPSDAAEVLEAVTGATESEACEGENEETMSPNRTPEASDNNDTMPVASDNNDTMPVASDNNDTMPVASDNNDTMPVASDNNDTMSVASDNNDTMSVASDNNDTMPLACDNNDTTPVSSDNSNTTPVESDNSDTRPVESDNSDGQILQSATVKCENVSFDDCEVPTEGSVSSSCDDREEMQASVESMIIPHDQTTPQQYTEQDSGLSNGKKRTRSVVEAAEETSESDGGEPVCKRTKVTLLGDEQDTQGVFENGLQE